MNIPYGVIFIAVSTLVALSGLFVVRSLVKMSTLARHTGIADPLLGVVGTLFSVLLGFMVAGALDNYEEAKTIVDLESNGLADVFRLANGLPDPLCSEMRNECRAYADAIITHEWPSMERGETCQHTARLYQQLWHRVLAYDPSCDRQNNIHATMLNAMQTMGENRRRRLVALHQQPSIALWLVILSGSVITIAFTYFLPARKPMVHGLMTGFVAVSLGLNVALLHVYSHPFSGDLKIPPAGFILDRELFNEADDPIPGPVSDANAKLGLSCGKKPLPKQ